MKKVSLAAEPYTAVVSADGKTLFVSLWGGSKVLMFAADTMEPLGEIAVGGHPNAMLLSQDGTRLFVACANTNAVWVVDLATRTAKEQISVALYPNAPGRHDAERPRVVARRDDACSLPTPTTTRWRSSTSKSAGSSEVEGWVPVGWYPTSVMFSRDGSRFFVLNGKGLTQRVESARAAARQRARRGALHRQHAAGRAVDDPDA